MDNEGKAKKFLKELDLITEKYGLEVTAEGTSPLLYDKENRRYTAFGRSFFDGNYKIYSD